MKPGDTIYVPPVDPYVTEVLNARLRDEVAMAALTGIYAISPVSHHQASIDAQREDAAWNARQAFFAADAFMAERERRAQK